MTWIRGLVAASFLGGSLGCALEGGGIGPAVVGIGEPSTDPDGVDAGLAGDAALVSSDGGRGVAEGDRRDGALADGAMARIDVDASPPRAGCAIEGAYAMRVEFDVTWDDTRAGGLVPLVAAGSGTLAVYSLATVHEEGDHFAAQIEPCGTDIPDFAAAGALFSAEQYGVYVPDAVWDRPSMPSWLVEWRLACRERGCPVQSSVLDAFLGGTPRAPIAGRAARGARDLVTPIDVDGDRMPGLTVLTRGPSEQNEFGVSYAHPPLGLGLRGRAARVMLAISMRAHFGGQIETCDAMSGESNDGEVDAFALGCTSRSALGLSEEALCDEQLVSSLDQNLPIWEVRSARFRTERVATASCEEVRKKVRTLVSP